MSKKKTIGIIGGMGPLATADLYKKIIENTPAKNDSEHIRVCIDSNINIPDRTTAILHGGADPVPEIVRSAILLEGMGADFLIMPCNTAHYFYNRIVEKVHVPIINMLDETAREVVRKGFHRIGLLATDGTLQTGVYDRAMQPYGIQILRPSEDNQKHVMNLIYEGIKAGNYKIDLTGFYRALDELKQAGAETLILGCTELPLAFSIFSIDQEHIDPTLVLAKSAIKMACAE
jgi:aspartate racemase